MATNFHLKIDGINGDSTDANHKNEIDITSWGWGLSQSGGFQSSTGGSGAGIAKVNAQDISIVKNIDSATTALQHACCAGVHIDSAVVTLTKAAGSSPLDYYVLTLTNVMVSSHSLSSGGDESVTEHVTLNFAQFQVAYQTQDAQGAGSAAGNAGWNFQTNSAP
jgi:type VI secretion system secreted protein Hcp